MHTWQVSFSLSGEHLKDLQEALGLQSVQQVLDLSDTIIKVREVINPLALVKDSSLQQKGSVLVIADYPLTGKSCLAFNLAKDWLDTTNVENVLEPVVLVLSPGTQADWSVERLDAEIRATTGSYAAGIQTLVIIDNLEECVQKATDLNELLAWLFEPAFGYHKLFLYTTGMVFERRIQNILRTHLMRLEESTASSQRLFRMEYEGVLDLGKLLRAFINQKFASFYEADKAFDEERLQTIKHAIELEHSSGILSCLVGLANQTFQSSTSQMASLEAALVKTKISEQLKDKDNRDAYTVFHILAALYSHYRLPLEYGYSEEFVYNLFKQEVQEGWTQFEAALDCLMLGGMIRRDNGLIWTSALQLSVIEQTAGSFFQLDSQLNDLRLHLVTPRAWLNMGMLCLARGQAAEGCSAFIKFLGDGNAHPDQELVVDYLANFVLHQVMPDIFEKRDHPMALEAGYFAKITDLVNKLFENNENVALLQAIVDAITTKVCQLAVSSAIILLETLEIWKPLVNIGSNSQRILISFALNQLLLAEPDDDLAVYLEKIRTLLSVLDARYLDKAKAIDLSDIFLLIASMPYAENDVDFLLSVLYNALFGEQHQLPFAQFLESDLWHQSVSFLFVLVEALDARIKREDFLKWSTAVLKHVIREQSDIDESGIALLCLLKALIASPEVKEETNYEFTKLLSRYESQNYNRQRLLFQIYLGPALYYMFVGHDTRLLRNYFQVILKDMEDVAALNNYNASFQINLVFYRSFFTYLCKSNWIAGEIKSELETHIAQVDSWLLKHVEELYIVDELAWGCSYKELMNQVLDIISIDTEPKNWDESICLSYLILMSMNKELVVGDVGVSELMNEGLSFCQISGVAQEWSQHMAGFNIQSLNEQTEATSVTLTPGKLTTARRLANPPTTIFLLQQRVEINLADQNSWYLLGLQMVRRHDDLMAIRSFQRAITLAPNFLEPYLEIARIYHKVGKLEQEVRVLTGAFEVNNDTFEVCIRLARAYRDLKEYTSAINFYRLAQKLSSENELFAVLRELGDIQLIEEQRTDALESYWYALSLNPFESELLITILKLLKDLTGSDQPSESELEYLGYKISYPRLAKCLIDYLSQRVSSSGDNIVLVKAAFLTNDFEKAWSLLLKWRPPTYIYNFSNMFTNFKRRAASILKESGHETLASFYYGLSYLESDLYEEASEQFIDYLKRYAKDAEARYYLALCYAAMIKVQRDLRLLEPTATSHFNLALKEGLMALFLGTNRQQVHELLGDIYFLKGETNPFFYNYAISHYEEVYFAAFSPELIIKIGQVRFDRLIETFATRTSIDIQAYTRQVKAEVLDWLRIHLNVQMDSKFRADIYGALGKIALLAVQAFRRWVNRDFAFTTEIEQNLLNAEDDLRKAIENQQQDFNFYMNLGLLYWEWQSWLVDQTEKRIEKIEQAIDNWERAQALTRDRRLPRTQRVVREEMEIMISSAFKELKRLI